jgi:hypothetical protein
MEKKTGGGRRVPWLMKFVVFVQGCRNQKVVDDMLPGLASGWIGLSGTIANLKLSCQPPYTDGNVMSRLVAVIVSGNCLYLTK